MSLLTKDPGAPSRNGLALSSSFLVAKGLPMRGDDTCPPVQQPDFSRETPFLPTTWLDLRHVDA
jgi:hypothetical protein